MNVNPGVHLLTAELVNNDHTALNPPVVAACVVTVMPPGAPPSASATAVPSATSASVTPSATVSPTASPSVTASPTVSVSPSTTASPAPSGAPSGPIDLVAQNIAFNIKTITVKAGSMVTINFNNMDNGIPHNFAAYTDSSASTPIFVGAVINGPSTTTYTFNAPATPGTFFFRCDVHPTIMTGQFIVQ
jgi:plastocyanin